MKNTHSWNNGEGGRAIGRVARGDSYVTAAILACTTCSGQPLEIPQAGRSLMPPEAIDKKARQKGWELDPARCPTCIAKTRTAQPKGTTTMAAEPTNAAVQSQARVFRLLTAQFDVDAGRYTGGYTDAKIAEETGASVKVVETFRRECFGELKEDPALAEIRNDLKALEELDREHRATVAQQIAELRSRLAQIASPR